ncbi:GNAT family N-acetyltransferase [Aestuariibaculum sp. M13]|uniref:GNAT family N-acetyltransferase n=1 Tax=Aestuariibaculum sp. M13 TaxID=2967132 RepID=UPI002159FBFF|nr:GNAT family N-acetyltransferase [Aestuariibaculum sp. M13]MCR8666587.1 GNAT family N-acetyltransferase [Aestuariibaculum sp. M13]
MKKINKSKIHFRNATKDDAETLANYRINYINEVLELKNHPKAIRLKIELIDYFSKSIEEEIILTQLAEYENEIIATGVIVISQAPPSYESINNKGRRGYVLNVFTLKEYRGNGIAKELLKKLIKKAKREKLEFLNLHATQDGINIYKDLGFDEPKFPELKLTLK